MTLCTIHTSRKQIYRLQLYSFFGAVGLSMPYFLQCATFAYGSKLVMDGEMDFGTVFR